MISVLLTAVGVLASVLLYNKVNQQFTSAQSLSSFDISTESFYSVAYMAVEDFDKQPLTLSRLSFLIVDKENLKIVIYDIPVTSIIDAPGKYGLEPFSNLLAIGVLNEDSLEDGAKLVTQSILKLFGFPVDRYILVDSAYEPYVNKLIHGTASFSLLDIDLSDIKDSLKTDFTLKELVDMYKLSNSLPSERIVEKSLSETYFETPSVIDEELLDITFSGAISKENKSLAVLNGTSESGIANFCARLIRNLGGRVVAVGNTYDSYETSLIIVDDPNSSTARILAHALNIDEVMSRQDAKDFAESEISRADITIIVGLDLALSL